MKFTELQVEGYRSLVDVILPLRPLMVMIGPNGSGKTALLEIIHLLKEAMQGHLSAALEDLGGLQTVLSRPKINPPNRLKVGLVVDAEDAFIQEPIRYRFCLVPRLVPRPIGYSISFEQLEWQRQPETVEPYYYIQVNDQGVRYRTPEEEGWMQPNWDYQHSELALAQVPKMYKEPEALRNTLARTRYLSYLDVGRQSPIRLPQSLTPTVKPGPNGENLYSTLYNLRTSHDEVYDQILDTLYTAFPDFERLEFPVVGAGQVTMAWYQTDLSAPLYPTELSEGTLRFLWLATVLLSPDPAPIILIDEPEVSLHPEMLKLLSGLLRDAALRSQVIVATHAADLVRWLEPEEVVVLDKIEGRTQFTWADSLNLTNWLKEYTLGELWLMGTLGGRP